MTLKKVDMVLAIDSSASMAPCFQGLVSHLEKLIAPLQADQFELRLGLIAMSASDNDDGILYQFKSLAGESSATLEAIYKQGNGAALFTTDRPKVISALREIKPVGDEDLLMLLDFAADFPFTPSLTTRRVIALFSDEPIEDGTLSQEALARIPDLCRKLMARRIKFFASLPDSPAAQRLAETDQSEFECVAGGDGLKSVDFAKLLKAMAKSISVYSQQNSMEERYTRGLFGQESFVEGHGEMTGA